MIPVSVCEIFGNIIFTTLNSWRNYLEETNLINQTRYSIIAKLMHWGLYFCLHMEFSNKWMMLQNSQTPRCLDLK